VRRLQLKKFPKQTTGCEGKFTSYSGGGMDPALIEKAVSDLRSMLLTLAPNMKPNIFPSYLPINSPASFFVNEHQLQSFQEWLLKNNCDANEIAMETTIDYQNRNIIVNKIMVRHQRLRYFS
jgi:hypothetical protein